MTDGSRLVLVCDVALGRCRDLHKRDFTLTQAPEGHHSVHGVHRTPNVHSEFEVGACLNVDSSNHSTTRGYVYQHVPHTCIRKHDLLTARSLCFVYVFDWTTSCCKSKIENSMLNKKGRWIGNKQYIQCTDLMSTLHIWRLQCRLSTQILGCMLSSVLDPKIFLFVLVIENVISWVEWTITLSINYTWIMNVSSERRKNYPQIIVTLLKWRYPVMYFFIIFDLTLPSPEVSINLWLGVL